MILPIWHGITREDLLQYGPAFADRLAKNSIADSYDDIVKSLLEMLGRPVALRIHPCDLAQTNHANTVKPSRMSWLMRDTMRRASPRRGFMRTFARSGVPGQFTFENSEGACSKAIRKKLRSTSSSTTAL